MKSASYVRLSTVLLIILAFLALGAVDRDNQAGDQSKDSSPPPPTTQQGQDPGKAGADKPSQEKICKADAVSPAAVNAVAQSVAQDAAELLKQLKPQAEGAANPPIPVEIPVSSAAPLSPPDKPRAAENAELLMKAANTSSEIEQVQELNAKVADGMRQAESETDSQKREEAFGRVVEVIHARDQLLGSAITHLNSLKMEANLHMHGPIAFRDSEALRTAQYIRDHPSAAVLEQVYNRDARPAVDLQYTRTGTHFFSNLPPTGLLPSKSRQPSKPPPVPPPPVPEPAASVKEPGGIKFSSERAEQLAASLDVDSIAFDPVQGRIVVSGSKSSEGFDLDVFADVLRLADERYEPFFSLDPSDAKEWDDSIAREQQLIAEKYKNQDIIYKIRDVNPEPIRYRGKEYYYTTVDSLDSDIFLSANRGHDVTTKLMFSPAWLRYSKVGWILYRADLAIKGIASGFMNRDGAIEPAFAWKLPDFEPEWLQHDISDAGRANFTLAKASVIYHGPNRIDLSDIHPELFVTDRRSGTNADLPPSGRDKAISDHFQKHWKEYVDNVPEIARLQMVYRAYVAARFLRDNHLGLAARIRSMPGVSLPQKPPLRVLLPVVVYAWKEGDYQRLMFGAGYGGGILMAVDKATNGATHIDTKIVFVKPNDWLEDLIAASTWNGGDLAEHGDQTAVVLDFNSQGPPASWYTSKVGPIIALIFLSAGAGVMLRRFDWQRLAKAQACGHCARLHAKLGSAALLFDLFTAGSLIFLAVLPLAAMASRQPISVGGVAVTIAPAVGLAGSCILLGIMCAMLMDGKRPDPARGRGIVPAAFTGARLLFVVLAVFLFHGGFSETAIGANMARLLTSDVTEQVFVVLGSARPIAWAGEVGLLAFLISLILRWALPFAFHSRPLALYSGSMEQHAH